MDDTLADRPTAYTETLQGGIEFEMRLVEGGSFQMGSEKYGDEKPIHTVQISSFFMAQYPVTQGLWKAVLGKANNPFRFKSDSSPVERVSWEDTQGFIQKLNEQTGQDYRLPTEAEWEYAARGGKDSHEHSYNFAGSDTLEEVAWYYANTDSLRTMPVGLKAPNALGLYDMSGNVYEWCQDWYAGDYYSKSPEKDPKGPSEGSSRVIRGGSWSNEPDSCRVAYRNRFHPDSRFDDLGFRLARTINL